MSADLRCEAMEQFAGELPLLVERNPEAEAKLRVVFEERIRPGRSAALRVLALGSGRQVAAVDGRAAGGVGDEQAGRRRVA